MEHFHGFQRDETEGNGIAYIGSSQESIDEHGIMEDDAVLGLDDIILSEDAIQENEQYSSQDEEMKGVTTEMTGTDHGQPASLDHSELQTQVKETELPNPTEIAEVDYEDEGIGLDGNELDDVNELDINRRDNLEEGLSPAADRKSIRDDGS